MESSQTHVLHLYEICFKPVILSKVFAQREEVSVVYVCETFKGFKVSMSCPLTIIFSRGNSLSSFSLLR